MGIIGWIIIGAIAGFLAEKIMKRDHGLLTNIIVGIVGGILGGWLLSGASPTLPSLVAILPQLVFTVLLYPLVASFISRLDEIRLRRWRRV